MPFTDPEPVHLVERTEDTLKRFAGRVRDVQNHHRIMERKGNWNFSAYTHGMYNALELALSILENREAVYKDVPGEGYLQGKADFVPVYFYAEDPGR